MAEAVFRHKVKQAGLENQITIDSAGTSDYHEGSLPHEGTRSLLDKAGISYEGMVSRPLISGDLNRFDYILTMDEQNPAKRTPHGNRPRCGAAFTRICAASRRDRSAGPLYGWRL